MCDETPASSGNAEAYVCKCLLTYLRLLGKSPQQDIAEAAQYWTGAIVSVAQESGLEVDEQKGTEL